MTSTQPTIRIVNGKPIHFYSPQQIAEAIPVDERLPKQSTNATFKVTSNDAFKSLSKTGYHHY